MCGVCTRKRRGGPARFVVWPATFARPRAPSRTGSPRWTLRAWSWSPGRTCATRPAAIELRGIDKSFGAVHANKNVDLTIAKGSIHGIIGENGAGKSTLMSILYGFYTADAGDILINGKPVKIHGSHDAIAAGIGMVHQHFTLADNLSAFDNLVLGTEPLWRPWQDLRRARTTLKRLMAESGLSVDLAARVATLSVGERQRVEILKALYREVQILVLDEPTSSLTPQEVDGLFGSLKTMVAKGMSVVFITHKIREVLAVCDRMTVLRGGRHITTIGRSDASEEALARAMVGEALVPSVAGADTIVTLYHGCTRELGKFASDRLRVRHYISIAAEALGVAKPDRFSEYWRLGDPEKVKEAARPNWESWGMSEEEARQWSTFAYATFMGNLQIRRDVPEAVPEGEKFSEYVRLMIRTLIPHPRAREEQPAAGPAARAGASS